MITISATEHFDCSQEQAFLAVNDFPNVSNYVSGIIKIEMLTEGPLGVGTKVRETRKMFGREASEDMTITTWDSPNLSIIEANSFGTHYVSTFTFTSENGGTKVERKFEVRPQTLMAKIMGFFMGGMMKSMDKLLAQDLADAKVYAEKSAGGSDAQ